MSAQPYSSHKSVNRYDIEAVLPLKTWWATLLVLPLSIRLIEIIVNRTRIKPNTITFIGVIFRMITALCFFLGSEKGLAAGAFSYVAAYVMDCTDGAVARLTGQKSEFGRYLDHVSDLLGDIVILLALGWSLHVLTTVWLWAMICIHLAESYISYLTGFVLQYHKGSLGSLTALKRFNLYRNFFFKRNLKSFFSFPDYTAVVFVFFPIFGLPALGLQLGCYFLVIIAVYTIISSFTAIHTDLKFFP